MKNTFLVLLFVCIILLTSSCAKISAEPKTEMPSKSQCEKQDCNNCPDIEPYLEGHNEFWGSNSQMIYWSDETLKSLYSRYDKLCEKIVDNFKEDKSFVEAFKKEKVMFENYRESREQLVRPRQDNYGMYMPIYSKWGYDYSLTVEQIERTKKNIFNYCDVNSVFLKNPDVCSEQKINSMFDEVKLKTPKPIISTPYDEK